MPPNSSPPIPTSFTPRFREQQRARAIAQQANVTQQAQIQAEQAQIQAEQEEQKKRFIAQQQLQQRYARGEVSLEEYKSLQNYALGQRDTSAEDYANYLVSYGKPVPASIVRMFPQHGISYTEVGSKPKPKPELPIGGYSQVGGGVGINSTGQPGFNPPQYSSNPTISRVPASNIYGTETYKTNQGNALEIPATPVQGGKLVEPISIRQTTPIQNRERFVQESKQNYTSNIPILNTAESVTKGTDLFVMQVGRAMAATFSPFALYRNKKSRQMIEVTTTQAVSVGQYFVPYYGEIKIGSDILTQIKQGKTERVASDIFVGAIIFGATKGIGKGLGFAEQKIVQFFPGTKIASSAPKVIGAVRGGVETSYLVGLAGIESSRLIGYQSQLESNIPVEQIQSQIVEDSRSIAGISLGFAAGQKVAGVAREAVFRVQGKEFIPIEKIGDPSVISGQKTFPESTRGPRRLIQEFEQTSGPYNGPGGYTATRSNFPQRLIVGKGTSETPGIYIAPTPSIFFLRLNRIGETSGVQLKPDLLSSGGSPLIARIQIPVKELPYSVQRAYEFGRFGLKKPIRVTPEGERIFSNQRQLPGEKAFESLSKDSARISPQFTFRQKIESEAIIPPETILLQTSDKSFTRVYGEAVSIREYKNIESNYPKILTSNKNDLINVKSTGDYSYPNRRKVLIESPIINAPESQRSTSSNVIGISITQPIRYSIPDSRQSFPNRNQIATRYPIPTNRRVFSPEPRQPFRVEFPNYPVSPTRSRINYEEPIRPIRVVEGNRDRTPYLPPPIQRSFLGQPRKNQVVRSERQLKTPGFLVQLFRRGKPIGLLRTGPLTREQAIAAGSQAVDTSILRSFKILQTGAPARPSDYSTRGNILRLGKRDKQLFVERSRFAISTRGEKSTLRSARQAKGSFVGLIKI